MRSRSLGAALVAVLALSVAACGGTGPGADDGVEELKLAHIAAPGTAYDNLAHDFKKRVEEKSGGRYTVVIYPAGQLGVDRELMESLQNGNIDLTVITASDINQFVPDMAVQDLPYLFRDWDHVEKFIASPVAQELYTLTEPVHMKTLGFMPRGFRHVTTNPKPINRVEDLAGMKMRVAESEIYIDTFKALGANAQAMAWGEVFTALQQGTIDGHENTVVTTRDYKIYEVQKYMSETSHFFAFAALQMSTWRFDKLPPADQQMIQDIATESCKALGLEQKNDEAAAKKEMQGHGMVFNTIEDTTPFRERVKPVYDTYFTEHDRKIVDAIEAIQ